jgi:formamidopyrimidine-DNA glycosylase
MPELPEVEAVRANTERACSGRLILTVDVINGGVLEGCSAEKLDSFCRGRIVSGVRRHGKQMFIELDQGSFVTVHLGMTGDLVFRERKEKPGKYDHVLFNFNGGSQLAYQDMRKFGAIGHAASIGQFLILKGLGPDALKIGKQEFASRVGEHHRAIKTVLLDQKIIAGIGNLYGDEVLFQSRIHPLRLANGLSAKETVTILRNIRKVLQASVRVASDFDRLPKGFMLPVRGLGVACPRRNGKFISLKVNGRTTYYCPTCQTIQSNK